MLQTNNLGPARRRHSILTLFPLREAQDLQVLNYKNECSDSISCKFLLSNSFTEIQFTCHTQHPFSDNLVIFRTVRIVRPSPDSNFRSPPKRNPTLTCLLSLQICLLRTFHMTWVTQYVILWDWLLFTQHNAFKGHPCHSLYQYFNSLLWPTNILYRNIPHAIHPFISR